MALCGSEKCRCGDTRVDWIGRHTASTSDNKRGVALLESLVIVVVSSDDQINIVCGQKGEPRIDYRLRVAV